MEIGYTMIYAIWFPCGRAEQAVVDVFGVKNGGGRKFSGRF